MTSRLGTGKSPTFFTVQFHYLALYYTIQSKCLCFLSTFADYDWLTTRRNSLLYVNPACYSNLKQPNSQSLNGGYSFDSDIGLSYTSLADRDNNPVPESTISPPVREYEFGYWAAKHAPKFNEESTGGEFMNGYREGTIKGTDRPDQIGPRVV